MILTSLKQLKVQLNITIHRHLLVLHCLTLLDYLIFIGTLIQACAKNRKDVLVVVKSDNLAFPKINFLNKTITVNSQNLTDIYTTSTVGLFFLLYSIYKLLGICC